MVNLGTNEKSFTLDPRLYDISCCMLSCLQNATYNTQQCRPT